jgi:hypothetical protein
MSALKFRPRLNVFKDNPGKNVFNGKRATSYGHYTYAVMLPDGRLVVAANLPSLTTKSHAHALKALLGYPENVVYIHNKTDMDLTYKCSGAIHDAIEDAQGALLKPRIRQTTKDKIAARIAELQSQLTLADEVYNAIHNKSA